LSKIGSKTAEKNSAQTNKQTDRQTNRHYENNGHLAMNQKLDLGSVTTYDLETDWAYSGRKGRDEKVRK